MMSLLRTTALATALAGLTACGQQTPNASNLDVTDVNHTAVKRQSIGNCWLYAQTTWLESMLKTQTGTELDVSESYFTWWHWYDQMLNGSTEISTGGGWWTSTRIILAHGFVLEGEFIPSEANAQMSATQAAALAKINALLADGGALHDQSTRTPEAVRAALDTAWGTNMAAAEALARKASDTIVGQDAAGPVTLEAAIDSQSPRAWREINLYSTATRNAGVKRAMKALNDYKPVLMSILIDFNAQDTTDNGSFKKSLLDTRGAGHQGGHMVVLEDYTVKNAPGFGTIGRGDATPAQKAAALLGTMTSLVAKNSWGTNRFDRGMIDGYTEFYSDYLLGKIDWKNDDEDPSAGTTKQVPLNAFVLPPGY